MTRLWIVHRLDRGLWALSKTGPDTVQSLYESPHGAVADACQQARAHPGDVRVLLHDPPLATLPPRQPASPAAEGA